METEGLDAVAEAAGGLAQGDAGAQPGRWKDQPARALILGLAWYNRLNVKVRYRVERLEL